MLRPILIVVAVLLVAVPALAAKPVDDQAYKKAKEEMKTKGSVPYVDALSVSKGKGHLEGFKPTSRIVGGTDASISTFTWQVSIRAAEASSNADGHFCGGSLVKPGWVVTAAHCLDGGTSPDKIKIVTGTDNLNSGGTKISAAKIIIHPRYNPSTNDNDVALVKLASKSTMQPIPLITKAAEASVMTNGATATISGWGYTKEDGKVSTKLQQATVPLVNRQQCNGPDAYDGQITDNMICAGKDTGGVDSCQGDSGGPLAMKKTGGSYVLAGIVSWGEGCAREGKPGVYTRVAKYASWVNQKINAQ
jgi:secreted trypsin-like serine protease